MLPGRHAQAVQDVLGLRRWGYEERVVDVWPELAHGSSSSGMTVYLTLGGEDLGHVLVGDDPVVHVIAQGIHVEVVPGRQPPSRCAKAWWGCWLAVRRNATRKARGVV